MDKDYIVGEIISFVRKAQLKEKSGHDWYHTKRVYDNAMRIAKDEKNADLFIVQLGALLHDIADHKFGFTDDDRTRIITLLLYKYDVDVNVIANVVYIANNISFKGGKNKHVMKTIEGKIVQDADRLDAIGSIGIARTFTYGGHNGRQIYIPDADKPLFEEPDTISHFYEKMIYVKDRMNTQTGRKMAEGRHEVLNIFLNEFYKELNNEI